MNETLKSMNRQAQSRARRAANVMRIAATRILKGKRSGREYKIPFYNVKYKASAPGEPPAPRSGEAGLLGRWHSYAIATPIIGGMKITARIQSDVRYAPILNEGTKDGRIAPRPFADKIINEAFPKVRQIYKERFLN